MRIFKLLISSLFALVTFGCGGGGGASSSDAPTEPTPPTNITKDYTITMSEVSVKRISDDTSVDVSVEGISSSGTVVVTQ